MLWLHSQFLPIDCLKRVFVCWGIEFCMSLYTSCLRIKNLCHKLTLFKRFTNNWSWHTIVPSLNGAFTSVSWSIHLLIQMSPSHGLHLLFIYFIFSCDFYLMLGRLRFHVFHWFLFNERDWFALIECSLITMKLTVSMRVHHDYSTGKPAHKLVNCEEMDKEHFNKPCGISFVRLFFFWAQYCLGA